MMRLAPAVLVVSLLVCLAGCQQPQKEVAKAPPPLPAKELVKTDIKVGTGPAVKNGDLVSVRYKGWLDDGTVFDENSNPEPPYMFTVGAGAVIKGWDLGVVGMKQGGKRNLRIPYKLAYGEEGSSAIPPKADLNFDVEIENVESNPNEVTAEVIKNGAGPAVKAGDTITIEYKVVSMSGNVIDSSEDHGGPTTVEFGDGRFAASAMEAAMKGMKAGEVRKIRLPPAYAMPSMGEGGKPEAQIVTITLIKIG